MMISHERLAQISAHVAKLRPPQSDIDDLRYYWNEFESDIGLRSRFLDEVAALRTGIVPSGSSWSEPEVERRACVARARGLRIARVLAAMDSPHVTVLYRMYGPTPPNARWEVFGEYAPLAVLTPTVTKLAEKMLRARRANVCLGEVLRSKLDGWPARQPRMSDEAYARLCKERACARAEFVRTVRNEAEQLLVRACHAYRAAKGAS